MGPEALSVDAALGQARALGLVRLDAQLILGHVLQRDRSWLIAHGEQALTSPESQVFREMVGRRVNGVPLAYLLGHREFHGLRLGVTPAVLDPRPDTETLVDWALDIAAGMTRSSLQAPAQAIDLGTGSGAIALAFQAARPDWRVCATDVSLQALAVAQGNATALGVGVEFRAGHWWDAVPQRRFDLALSNPPYIAENDPHLPALIHEPITALVSGPDGLHDLRQIIAGAPTHLRPGGWLLLEHGHDQAEAVAACLTAAGFTAVSHRQDLAGHRRCTGGCLAR